MAAVHENVHQRAGEDQQKGPIPQVWDEMRPMLGHEEEATDREKADQDDISGGSKKAAFTAIVVTVIHACAPPSLDRATDHVGSNYQYTDAGSLIQVNGLP
jgi:hypothetical protein